MSTQIDWFSQLRTRMRRNCLNRVVELTQVSKQRWKISPIGQPKAAGQRLDWWNRVLFLSVAREDADEGGLRSGSFLFCARRFNLCFSEMGLLLYGILVDVTPLGAFMRPPPRSSQTNGYCQAYKYKPSKLGHLS